MTTTGRRNNAPLLLAVLAMVGAAFDRPEVAPLLLFCPGWGLLRCVSVLDRNFAALGSALCLSWIVLGAGVVAGNALDLEPGRTGLLLHLLSVGLCLVGRVRLAAYDRWAARQPPHPAPMPLWPERLPATTALLLLIVLATGAAAPPGAALADGAQMQEAAVAMGWLRGGEHPLDAGRALAGGELATAPLAGLVLGAGVDLLRAGRLISLAALAACLLLVAESISRLIGNRGAGRAVLAFVLGLNPLAVAFLLLGEPGAPVRERMLPADDPGLDTALAPFVDGAVLPMTLAFVALLLFASLSILRRASTHVPRVAALATFGLVVADTRAALLLLPGWVLGLLMSHLACRESPDNDPHVGGAVRRPREPVWLRAPFWRPFLHLTAGAATAFALVGLPDVDVQWQRLPAWGLVSAVGPGCLLFMPGVRHLNASPGREAFFFVGLTVLLGLLAVTLRFPGEPDALAVRLAALVLSVPAAHGAVKLAAATGPLQHVGLGVLTGVVALAPSAWLVEQADLPRPLGRDADGRIADARLDEHVRRVLIEARDGLAADAALVLLPSAADVSPAGAALLVGRPVVASTPDTAPVLARLEAGEPWARGRLRSLAGLHGRELGLLGRGPAPQGGFELAASGPVRLTGLHPPDIVLVTVSCLRADRVDDAHTPRLAHRARRGTVYARAFTPNPTTAGGLASLFTGLSPVDHGVHDDGISLDPRAPHLAQRLQRRGYRTAAVVSLEDAAGLTRGFEEVAQRPGAPAAELVRLAMQTLGAPDPRPLLLWVHLSDLEPPYVLPPALQRRDEDRFPFGALPDGRPLAFARAAWPPSSLPVAAAGELDVADGIARYDALVAELDRALDPLLESVPDEDLFVLTAPHGTALDEHQAWFSVGLDLFEPSIHVPLLVVGGGARPEVEERLTSLADLAEDAVEGRRPDRARILLESGLRPGLGTSALIDPARDPGLAGAATRVWGERTLDEKTLLTRPAGPEGDAAGVRYDLGRDPDEMQPLPADAFELRRLESWRRRNPPPAGDG